MTAAPDLSTILELHKRFLDEDPAGALANLERADLTGADLRWADLEGAKLALANLEGANFARADLEGANLGAHLRWAKLVDADLAGARFADAILSECKGIVWAQVGPIGFGPRTVTAIWDTQEVVYHGGCFTGNRAEWDTRIRSGGWDWPADRAEALAAQCNWAADLCHSIIHDWLTGIEAEQ